MIKRLSVLIALLIIASLALTACEAVGGGDAVKVCQVTDTGGIDDKSFNETAWRGIQQAEAELGIQGSFLESQQQTDYAVNLNACLEDGADLIIPVGFLLADDTQAAADANPDTYYSIIDVDYLSAPNLNMQAFQTDEAAFLAGYLAAGVSKTGKVGTFGGIQIPTVTIFMDGLYAGVEYYNAQKGTDVQVLGWDPATETGLFAGNFESLDDGRAIGESLMDEGADIIMPVAGQVGLGAAAAAQERGGIYIIGVDADWVLTSPQFEDIILTSVLKNMDATTFLVIESVVDGTFEEQFAGQLALGTLENNGVGLAPYHNLESEVSAELQSELEAIAEQIIAGTLDVSP
jgi:basic membrane protein A